MENKQEILSIMRQWAPEETAESWDNVGLQLDTNRDIDRVALVLELNLDTWNVLQQYDYDFIISHHPLIFDPLKFIDYELWTNQVLRDLIKKDVGLYVSHTNLDRASDGVSHALLRQFELNIQNESDLVDGYGKHITLNQPIDLVDIEDRVPVLAKIIPDNLDIQSVAFCGGSGKSFTKDVVGKNIDCYITGELGYHEIQYLRQQKKGLFLLGHYQSEVFVLDAIKNRLSSLNIDIEIIS